MNLENICVKIGSHFVRASMCWMVWTMNTVTQNSNAPVPSVAPNRDTMVLVIKYSCLPFLLHIHRGRSAPTLRNHHNGPHMLGYQPNLAFLTLHIYEEHLVNSLGPRRFDVDSILNVWYSHALWRLVSRAFPDLSLPLKLNKPLAHLPEPMLIQIHVTAFLGHNELSLITLLPCQNWRFGSTSHNGFKLVKILSMLRPKKMADILQMIFTNAMK